MKYALHFLYHDMSMLDIEADRYSIQNGLAILEHKKSYEGKILRADEKFTIFKVVNLRDVKTLDIQEQEENA